MKELLLVRHAKSDWGTEFLKDIDRPLNERGYKDAYLMGKWYAGNKKKPDFILSSTATRALSSALIFAREMEFDMKNFGLEEKLYENTVKEYIQIISGQPSSVNSLMIFCHNPTMTDFCNHVIDNFRIDDVPTCGIVSMNFKMDSWSGLSKSSAVLNYFQFPKQIQK